MGTLTLADFRMELLFDLKNRTDTSTITGITEARQNLWINAAYLWMTHPSVHRHRQMQYSETIPLLNGTSSYTFSPDPLGVTIAAIRSVSHLNVATLRFVKLLPKEEQWFMARSPQNGAPREYFMQGDLINVNPIPGANEVGTALVVSAWREPALLVDGQTTTLSSLWDEVLLLAARWRAELHLGYRDLAEATKVDVVGLLNEYKSFEDLQAEDIDWQVEVRTESAMESV